jgi:hypothetical protein
VQAWATYKLVLAITCDQFAVAIDDVYDAVLDNPTEGLNSVDLRTLVQHQMTTSLGNITNASIPKNATINDLGATNAALSKAI